MTSLSKTEQLCPKRFWKDKVYKDVTSHSRSTFSSSWQEAAQVLMRELIILRLREWLGDQRLGRIVDLGCGPGEWTARYTHLASEVVGVDINQHFLDAARRESGARPGGGRVRLVHSDIAEFADYQQTDLVCLGACIQYLSDQELDQLFGKLSDGLSAGNRIYIRTTVASPLRGSYRGHAAWFRTRSRYLERFKRCGFEVEQEFYTTEVCSIRALQDVVGLSPRFARKLATPVWRAIWIARAVALEGDHLNWFLRVL